MADTTIGKNRRNTASMLGLYGRMMALTGRQVTSRVALRALFAGVLISTMALEAIRFGVVERPIPLAATYQTSDPVVASVGRDVLRVSDAFAHAAFVGEDDAADVPTLIATGTVDEAIDHLTLAQAARESGIDQSVEVRALIALAERQILAEAYLDQVSVTAVSDEAIAERYAEEAQALADDALLRLYQIVVPSREEAETLAERALRGNFSKLAQQHSIDAATKGNGGALGDVRASDLAEPLRLAVAELPAGGVSEPIETAEGWYVLKLENRRALRPLPFAERRDQIAEELRQEAIASALDEARQRTPVRLRTANLLAAEGSVPAGRIGLAKKQ